MTQFNPIKPLNDTYLFICIGALKGHIADKQEQLQLQLRELQLEAGPRIRELKEQCEVVMDDDDGHGDDDDDDGHDDDVGNDEDITLILISIT